MVTVKASTRKGYYNLPTMQDWRSVVTVYENGRKLWSDSLGVSRLEREDALLDAAHLADGLGKLQNGQRKGFTITYELQTA